ncbi:MAG: hypothetical protein KJ025_05110 [Burkholderiales bacterium]|nr:hypothetical protein [Burkholderiales bacterium]
MSTGLRPTPPVRGTAWAACALVAFALAGGQLLTPEALPLASHGTAAELAVIVAAAAYVLALALPFVPGIEIGLAIMLVLGWDGIVLVYLCTQLALALSFALGRIVPARALAAAFGWLGMSRARRMVETLDRTTPPHCTEPLASLAPAPWLAVLARCRYLALALVLNLPGNAVIGGAGGIGMLAGLSRAYRFPCYVLVVAAATTPLPLFLLLTGLA